MPGPIPGGGVLPSGPVAVAGQGIMPTPQQQQPPGSQQQVRRKRKENEHDTGGTNVCLVCVTAWFLFRIKEKRA